MFYNGTPGILQSRSKDVPSITYLHLVCPRKNVVHESNLDLEKLYRIEMHMLEYDCMHTSSHRSDLEAGSSDHT